jgi:hypothetical protein
MNMKNKDGGSRVREDMGKYLNWVLEEGIHSCCFVPLEITN